jgi:hypothetical protein
MMATQSNRIVLAVVIGIGTRSDAGPTPCSLLTPAEVEQVVGKLMGTPKADQEGSAAWCNYEFADFRTGNTLVVRDRTVWCRC